MRNKEIFTVWFSFGSVYVTPIPTRTPAVRTYSSPDDPQKENYFKLWNEHWAGICVFRFAVRTKNCLSFFPKLHPTSFLFFFGLLGQGDLVSTGSDFTIEGNRSDSRVLLLCRETCDEGEWFSVLAWTGLGSNQATSLSDGLQWRSL